MPGEPVLLPPLSMVASGEQADQRRAEAAISPQPDPPSSGQLIPPTRGIPAAAQQPVPLAAVQNVVKDHLPGWLITQGVDRLGGAARPKRAPGYRLQDCELDQPKLLARLH